MLRFALMLVLLACPAFAQDLDAPRTGAPSVNVAAAKLSVFDMLVARMAEAEAGKVANPNDYGAHGLWAEYLFLAVIGRINGRVLVSDEDVAAYRELTAAEQAAFRAFAEESHQRMAVAGLN